VLALLYDVHGNLPALEAVLDDAGDQGVERYLLGGDYALFGGWPAETVERLDELEPATWIRGNGERWTADPADAPEEVRPAIVACREALGDSTVVRLADLPEQLEHEDGVLVCHGSPVSDVRSFFPEPADDESELLEGVTARRIVFGHTHVPFRRMAGGIELINPGSVGMPLDGDTRAAYAVVHPTGEVEHRRVAYDHSATADRVREVAEGADWGTWVSGRILRAEAD
jgi:predicted phosphodiesterase